MILIDFYVPQRKFTRVLKMNIPKITRELYTTSVSHCRTTHNLKNNLMTHAVEYTVGLNSALFFSINHASLESCIDLIIKVLHFLIVALWRLLTLNLWNGVPLFTTQSLFQQLVDWIHITMQIVFAISYEFISVPEGSS